jgi:hypothetical protein
LPQLALKVEYSLSGPADHSVGSQNIHSNERAVRGDDHANTSDGGLGRDYARSALSESASTHDSFHVHRVRRHHRTDDSLYGYDGFMYSVEADPFALSSARAVAV